MLEQEDRVKELQLNLTLFETYFLGLLSLSTELFHIFLVTKSKTKE